MLLVVIGMDTFIVQPGFVEGLVEHAGFGEKQAGAVASAEMFGITATTVFMAWLGVRLRWRTLAIPALLLDALANLLCLGAAEVRTFMVLRFVVGLASGVLISIGYAAVGLTERPDRNFGLLIMCVLIYGALGLLAMPVAFATFGLRAVLIFLAAAALLGLVAVRILPRDELALSPAQHAGSAASATVRASLLAGCFCFFLAQGVIWPYLALIGIAGHASEQQVAEGLTISQFMGIFGAWTAATLGTRLRHAASLGLGILGTAAPMFGFLVLGGSLVFGLSVCVFNYASNFVTPLLMVAVGSIDSSGRLVVTAVALQMLGLALGPALGATLIEPSVYGGAVWAGIALCLVCLALVLTPLVGRPRTGFAHTRR
jgi:predicted MFS family arabinose efflux permease